jgi:rare lipoprotein A (peptidoglycan hydrolase)
MRYAIFVGITLAMTVNADSISGRKTVMTGMATYYTVSSCKSEGTSGVLMASGKQYNESALICALPFHPRKVNGRRQWGQRWRITNARTGKSIVCEHWDYGPGRKARSRGVIVDLSPAAFEAIGDKLSYGKISVKLRRVR